MFFRFLVMFHCVFVFLNISYFSLIFYDFLKYFVPREVFSPLVAKPWQGNTPEWKKSSQEIKVSFKIPLGLVRLHQSRGGLEGIKSTSSQFNLEVDLIPSNPLWIGVTEHALSGLFSLDFYLFVAKRALIADDSPAHRYMSPPCNLGFGARRMKRGEQGDPEMEQQWEKFGVAVVWLKKGEGRQGTTSHFHMAYPSPCHVACPRGWLHTQKIT
jgi:hypothetical protein